MFNGDIYPSLKGKHLKIGPSMGGAARYGRLDGEPVVLKNKKTVLDALWKDELKEAFGLQKVGTSYFERERIILLKYHKNLGTVQKSISKVRPEAFGDWFWRLCAFDYSISNGDRHSNNILVLSPTKLLAIDEARKIRAPLYWCPRFDPKVKKVILQSIATIKTRADLQEKLESIITVDIEERIREVYARYPKLDSFVMNFTCGQFHETYSTVEWLDVLLDKFKWYHLMQEKKKKQALVRHLNKGRK
ncbi:MAG TPA: hypothetical protein VMW91_08300 [Desulfosporosinus sp.]|nr:hypothetical protein [Desulfosporosinus sp.]